MQMERLPSGMIGHGKMVQRGWLAFLVLLICTALPLDALKATHIVGGEIGYRCLGENRYEITLRVFRDCFGGDIQAPFDDPAAIGIFDRDGLLVRNLLVAKMGDDTLTNVIDECVINSRNVCVHTTTYRTVVTLAPRIGGYRFVYQRCCRNATVRNVVKPLETGATFEILLSEAAMARCNNSPQFRAWPPIFICRDEPLRFDHSATDEDGDSLVYRLFTPYQGGTFLFPQPIPPNSPPFDTVVWNNPPGSTIYSVDNMMGFGEPLVLNRSSGLMTARPGQIGQYVIGVLIEEYDRNTGQLLSETRRDFQYNVIECERITAVISAPSVQCDNLTVKFENNSENATDFIWYFEGPGFEEVSTDFSPTITFPDTGRYTATLVAEPGLICEHRDRHEVFLQYNSLKADFLVDVFDCFGGSYLQVRDFSADNVSPIVSWKWEVIVQGKDTLRSSAQAPEFFLATGIVGKLRLTVTSQNGCVSMAERTFETGRGRPASFISGTRIEACLGDRVSLNPRTPTDIPFLYEWSPAEGLENPNSINPTFTVTESRMFRVRISPINYYCDTFINVEVVLVDRIVPAFSHVPACDGFGVHFKNETPGDGPTRWVFGNLDNPIGDTVARDLTFTFPSAGTFPVSLISLGLCPDTLTRQVTVTGPFLDAAFSLKFIGCSDQENQVLFEDKTINLLNNTNSWRWILGSGQTSEQQNPVFAFADGTDSVDVMLVVGTAIGCQDTIETRVNVKFVDFAKVAPPLLVLACKGLPTPMNLNGDASYRYSWSPVTGLDNARSPNPLVTLTASAAYQVTISDSTGVCDTVANVQVDVIDLRDQVPQPAMVVCPDVATSLNPGSDPRLVYRWSPATGLSDPDANNPTVTTSSDIVYQLRVSHPLGYCDTTVTMQIKVADFPSVAPVPAMVVCPGLATALNPKGDPLYKYEWTPAEGLSATDVPNPTVTTTVDRTYQVRISDMLGNCSQTFTIQVKVADFPSVAPVSEMLVCAGIATPLNPQGDSLYKYEWTPAEGLSATNVPNPTVTTAVDRVYQVRISDLLNNCSETFTIQVRVADFPSVAPVPAMVVCPGIATPLNPKGNSLYRYAWTPSEGLSATDVPNPTVTTTVARSYLVRISDPRSNCSETFVVQVKPADFPSVAPVSEMLVCPGLPTALNPQGDSLYKYVWTPSEGLSATNVPNPMVTTTVDRLYQVRISDFLENCSDTFTIQVRAADFPSVAPAREVVVCSGVSSPLNPNGNPLYRYAWTPADGLSAVDVPNPTVTTTINRTYLVRISEPLNNCSETFAVQVVLPDFLSVGPDTLITVCRDVPTPMNPRGSSSFSYSWAPATGLSAANVPNPLVTIGAPEVYTVTIVDSTGRCSLSYPVRVNISPLMSADAGRDTTICSTGAFTVQGSADNAVRFQWSAQRNFSAIIGDNARQSVTVNRGNNTFYLRTTDALGCVEIDSVVVRALPLLASVPASITACLPDDRRDITVANGDSSQILSYRWTPSNLIISDPNAGPVAIVRAQTGATISVVVTNQAGCSATFNTRIDILNLPDILTIDAAENPIKKGETTTLSVRGCSDCTVQWSPSTGLGSTTGASVSAGPDKTTTYVATVSKAGCTDTLSITLVVEECVEPFVPNAFTPNGDNINDILYARVKDYQELRLIIYNRWGQEVFDTRDPEVGWDGTYRGRELPPDVYGYYVYVLCPDGVEYKKSGSISLIR